MQHRHMTAMAGLLVGLLIAGPQAQATNIVVNGGFETGDTSGWTQVENWATGLNFVTTNLPVAGQQHAVNPYSGDFMLSLGNPAAQSNPYAGLSQSFDTILGQQYTVSYWFNNNGEPSINALAQQVNRILWDGIEIDFFHSVGHTGWVQRTLTATGTGHDTLQVLGFSASGYNSYDNVCVTADGDCPVPSSGVPAPPAWLLLGLGLFGIGGLRRKMLSA